MRAFNRISISVLAATLAGALSPLGAAPARATIAVQCGQTLTTDVTLQADLGPCSGDGLIVTGDNVTLDLNGHTIRGGNLGVGVTPEQTGVRVKNDSGVIVRNGTVRDFYAGVVLDGVSHSTVTGMTLTHNTGTGTEENILGDGIYLTGSSYNTLSNNTVTDNGPYAGIDIWYSSLHNTVSYNYIADNNLTITASPNVPADQLDDGIHAEIGSSYTVVDHNRVYRNGHGGIAVNGHGVANSVVTYNDVRDNGKDGISASGNGGHLVSHNIVDHNGYDQFHLPGAAPNPGDGVDLCGTCLDRQDNPFTTIADNVITRNAGPGVAMVFNGFQILGGTGQFGTVQPVPYHPPRSNLVQRNTIADNTGDGIYVECDKVYDANFNATCMVPDPDHPAMRVLQNLSVGNGGANAGSTAWDLHDENPMCDHDVWHGNLYKTAMPPCTTAR
jgi:parallel beta-helix repeat protein